jgi:hypothetical protein
LPKSGYGKRRIRNKSIQKETGSRKKSKAIGQEEEKAIGKNQKLFGKRKSQIKSYKAIKAIRMKKSDKK